MKIGGEGGGGSGERGRGVLRTSSTPNRPLFLTLPFMRLWYWEFQRVSSVWYGWGDGFQKSALCRLLYTGFLRHEPCIFWFWQLLCRIWSERNDFRSKPLSFFAFCCWQRCQLFLLLPFCVIYLWLNILTETKPWRFCVGVPRSITALVYGGYVWIRGFFLSDG